MNVVRSNAVEYVDSLGQRIYTVIDASYVPRIGEQVDFYLLVQDEKAREYWLVKEFFPEGKKIEGTVTRVTYSVNVRLFDSTKIENAIATVHLDCELPEEQKEERCQNN